MNEWLHDMMNNASYDVIKYIVVGVFAFYSLKKNDKQITEFQIHSNKDRIPFLKKSTIANSDY